jgi:hypothetical protein
MREDDGAGHAVPKVYLIKAEDGLVRWFKETDCFVIKRGAAH